MTSQGTSSFPGSTFVRRVNKQSSKSMWTQIAQRRIKNVFTAFGTSIILFDWGVGPSLWDSSNNRNT